jgi:predicted RNase H-like nuclease (RuvC/YqgF family)
MRTGVLTIQSAPCIFVCVNRKITPPLLAAITAAIVVFVFHGVSSLALVLVESIRSSSVYEANNVMGDVLLTMTMVITIISVIAVRDARTMRAQIRSLRVQRDSLSTQCENLRAHRESLDTLNRYYRGLAQSLTEQVESLNAQVESLTAERDSYARKFYDEQAYHGRCKCEYRDYREDVEKNIIEKYGVIHSLRAQVVEWSNRYYALRARYGAQDE